MKRVVLRSEIEKNDQSPALFASRKDAKTQSSQRSLLDYLANKEFSKVSRKDAKNAMFKCYWVSLKSWGVTIKKIILRQTCLQKLMCI
jgi:hypothetical protein